jgi:hypothetical protein
MTQGGACTRSWPTSRRAKDYWLRREPWEREDHVYVKALCLMLHFGFEDLLEEDAGWRNIGHPEEWEEA